MGRMGELWREQQEANAMAEPDGYDADQARILIELRKWLVKEIADNARTRGRETFRAGIHFALYEVQTFIEKLERSR